MRSVCNRRGLPTLFPISQSGLLRIGRLDLEVHASVMNYVLYLTTG